MIGVCVCLITLALLFLLHCHEISNIFITHIVACLIRERERDSWRELAVVITLIWSMSTCDCYTVVSAKYRCETQSILCQWITHIFTQWKINVLQCVLAVSVARVKWVQHLSNTRMKWINVFNSLLYHRIGLV